MSFRRLIVATALAVTALVSFPAAAHDGAPAEVFVRPGKLPDTDLPAQAAHGTGVSGDFNPAALSAHWLKLQLADGQELHAFRKRQVNDPRRGESWVGEFEGAPGSLMVLTRFRGITSGFFHYGPDVYEIAPGPGGRHVLFKVDETKIPRNAPPQVAPAGETTGGTTITGGTTTAASGIVQDLLVLYTPASRARYGEAGIQTRIQSAVEAANQAYANSNIALSLNLVHMAETAYTETGDMGVALDKLRIRDDGVMDDAHTLRDQYGADLVSLVNEDGNYCGIAYVMTSVGTGFAPYAVSVTASNCLSNQTLAHEIGHNQGNMHDRESSSNPGAYPYSYGFRRCMTDGTGFRTVMAYSCSGGTRISHFANPYVYYNGYATGVDHEWDATNSADTARSMTNTAATVAAFRAGAPTEAPAAPSGLTASAASSARIDLRWSDNASNETGFIVERSMNGLDFDEVASLAAGVTGWNDTAVAALSTYWYRIRAWNSAGGSGYSNIAGTTTPDLPPAAPTEVNTVLSGSQVTVSWTHDGLREAGFDVGVQSYNAKRKTWSSLSVVGQAGAAARSFTYAPAAGTYRYSVRATSAGGPSAWTAAAASVTVTGTSTSGGGKGGRGGG